MKANLIYKISTVTFIAVITLLGLGGRGFCSDVSVWWWTSHTAGWYDFTNKSTVTATLPKNCKPDGGWVDLNGNGNIHCAGSSRILHFAQNNGQLTLTTTVTPPGRFKGYYWPTGTMYLDSPTVVTAVDGKDGSILGTKKLSNGENFLIAHTNVCSVTGNSLMELNPERLTPLQNGAVNLLGTGGVNFFESYSQWGFLGVYRGPFLFLLDEYTGAEISNSPFSYKLAASSASILVGANTGTGQIYLIPNLEQIGTFASSSAIEWLQIDSFDNIFAGSLSGVQYFNSTGTLQGQVKVPGMLGCAVSQYTEYHGSGTGLVFDRTTQLLNSGHTAATLSTNSETLNFGWIQWNFGLWPVQVDIQNSDTGDSIAKFKRLQTLFDGPSILSDGTGCNSTGGDSKIRFEQTFFDSSATTSVLFLNSTTSVQKDDNLTSGGPIQVDISPSF
ncbi:MAG: hypothetical protein ACLQVJ_26415 [Syntrophobacteraceae bacterium]